MRLYIFTKVLHILKISLSKTNSLFKKKFPYLAIFFVNHFLFWSNHAESDLFLIVKYNIEPICVTRCIFNQYKFFNFKIGLFLWMHWEETYSTNFTKISSIVIAKMKFSTIPCPIWPKMLFHRNYSIVSLSILLIFYLFFI